MTMLRKRHCGRSEAISKKKIIYMTTFTIDPAKKISLRDIQQVLSSNATLVLSDNAKKAISDCRTWLDRKMASQKEPVYGINTGFGSLCNVIIPDSEIEQLQTNLVMSHACGMGDEVPVEIVRLMLLLK